MISSIRADKMLADAPRELRTLLRDAAVIAPRPPGRLGTERWYIGVDDPDDDDNIDFHRAGMYLKIAHHEEAIYDLAAEHQHVRWLQGRLSVPKVVYFSAHDARDYLLLSEVAGLPSHHARFRHDRWALIDMLAEALDAITGIDVSDCPFGVTLDHELLAIEERLRLGLLDDEAFADAGRTPSDVFARLVRDRDIIQATVFTHGDLCMPNVIFRPRGDALAGIIDWGTAGLGDIHRDVAALMWSVEYNLGEVWAERLIDAWGGEVDPARIDYFSDLDLFF